LTDTITLAPNPTNKCFGCGGANDLGMKLTFVQDNAKRRIVGKFILGEAYQGGGGMGHGGIIALLLDEVMAGLRPTETDRMVATLREINRESGLTILLIEHVMRAVMALAARVLVLDHGVAIAAGTPEAVVRDPAVVRSYLGTEAL